ncbi:hypothetical protein NKR19_g2857 [Coniochaeta hoffmannii]|uniref:Uncharacterized protein n=1 Tax=Coniochaeta hoffmannii TaxID=91930 RepID=A0AA38W1Y6_9PEZI|nr:hypothetical protein NKR19_g2857 [Coniochaeta hoffmannii]
MEGSYDPVFSGPSTPMSPSAPSVANQYKANVNRTKTRKWVEAKTIDYGGDDWGGDYDDEPDEPEQQPQPPPKPQEEVQVDSNGRKGTMPGRDDDDSIAPRSSRPGLPTVAERKSEYGIEGLIASYEARGGTPTGTSQPGAFPLAATAESASVPASRDTVPAISSPTSRPSARNEIVGEQVEQGHSAAEAPELEKKAGAAQDKAFGSGHSQEKAVEEAQRGEEGAEIKKEQSGEELRRLSTSPKLPELGRLSVFGFDLFSSSTSSDAPTSSSFNLPGTSPPPPVPALPSAHSIVSPSSPLSTVIESPSPSSAQSAPAHDDLLEQAQEGQRSRDPAGPVFNEGTQLPTAPNAIPTEDSAGSSAASSDVVPTQPNARHTEPSHGEYGSPSGNSSPDLDPASARPGGATDLPQRAESPATSITNLHAPSRSLTMVTPDPQASQLGISAPVAIARDDPGSFEGEGQPTSDSKLALHPLLAQHAQQAKAIPPQVLPPPDLPGSLATDYDSYIQSSSTDDAAVPSSQTADNGRSDGGNVEPPTPKARLGEDTSTDTTPLHPSTAPPPPPVEITRGETYVTAVESPSGLEDEGSPIKSDKLSAEILRSLSPGAPKPTTATVESPGGGNRLTDKPSGAARESSFLPDLYDDYWSFAGTGNAADANAAPDVPVNPTSDAVPAALKVHADDPRPASLIVAKDDTTHTQSPPPSLPGATPRSSVDVFKTDVEAKTVELHRPVLRNRFSWERDGVEAAKIDVQVEPKSLSAKQDTSSTIDTHPAEIPAADVAASTSAEPMVKQPRAPSPSPAFEVENKAVTDNRSKSPTGSVQPNSPVLSPAVSDPVPEIGPDHVHLHPGPLSSNPVLTWQEIMAVPSQTDRIGELNKARAHYAAAETGLPTILENFASMHPDIVDARLAGGPTSPVYAYNAPTDQDAGGLLSPTALGTTPTIASRHHSNPTAHIGAKSKELFATAGKASKGFFSTLKAKGKKVAN